MPLPNRCDLMVSAGVKLNDIGIITDDMTKKLFYLCSLLLHGYNIKRTKKILLVVNRSQGQRNHGNVKIVPLLLSL